MSCGDITSHLWSSQNLSPKTKKRHEIGQIKSKSGFDRAILHENALISDFWSILANSYKIKVLLKIFALVFSLNRYPALPLKVLQPASGQSHHDGKS